MARWRAEALHRLPELRQVIQTAGNVSALWTTLYEQFCNAYAVVPRNESMIERIYSYADWCVSTSRGPEAGVDPLSAVVVSFYEEIPTYDEARDDMPQWFAYADVARNEEVFSYWIGKEAYDELKLYMYRHRKKYRPRVATGREP